MVTPAGIALLDHFAALRDPRQHAKVLYPLPEILLLVLSATIAGADDFVRSRKEPLQSRARHLSVGGKDRAWCDTIGTVRTDAWRSIRHSPLLRAVGKGKARGRRGGSIIICCCAWVSANRMYCAFSPICVCPSPTTSRNAMVG